MSDVCVIEAEAGVVDGEADRSARWRIEPERGQVDPEQVEEAVGHATRFLIGALSSDARWAEIHCWWEHRGT